MDGADGDPDLLTHLCLPGASIEFDDETGVEHHPQFGALVVVLLAEFGTCLHLDDLDGGLRVQGVLEHLAPRAGEMDDLGLFGGGERMAILGHGVDPSFVGRCG